MAEHPNKVAFQQGVTYIFKNWTALKLAVEQDWGGVDSAEKRDWMIDLITDYFGKNGKKVDVDEIEDILNQIMSDEFHTLLEDDSAYLVAKHLVELFHQCINGNFAEVERLRQKSQTQSSATTSSCVQQGDDDDDDDEQDDDIQDDDTMDQDDMELDNTTEEPPSGPDEDGWETVRTKKK
ncbi:Pre-rRNA-processing protein TSR2-domain-containing protein, partial [Halteromyces radiatus]|uniref:Pre-rRNA-processing protein TSR2-domain-containing protein n=1 Tax=Halteromyces radiatus TaxID=101107 RepID=UPI002220002B